MKSIQIYGENIDIYEMRDLDSYLEGAAYKTVNGRKTIYINEACSFDIETTSMYLDGAKTAFMYIWQLSICGRYIMGRTMDDFLETLEYVKKVMNINIDRRLVIYVHNLPFEFQFIRKYFEWEEVFSRDERKPLKAITNDGIEFRCSYALTNQSLDAVSKELPKKYAVKKLIGDLDYTLIRTPETPLTDKEIGYCINDIRIVDALIKTKIEEDGDITKIPLTLTGYVRGYVRKYCLNNYDKTKKYKRKESTGAKYSALMKTLTLDGKGEYLMCKRAFAGGYTHASIINTDKEHMNTCSYDITSSYPAVILSEKVPMSRGFNVKVKSEEEFRYNLSHYACLFDIKFYNLRPKEIYSENYISESKARDIVNGVVNNGRIAYADELKTTITDIDFKTIEEVYDYDGYAIGDFRCYKYGYFPKPFIECTLHFYKSKTELKGVAGAEKEYARQKGMLNSLYGMIVTDICKEDFIYEGGEWGVAGCDFEATVRRYNKSRKRFMFYPWGIWITAYARRNLYKAIEELKDDYIYSDTDSVKFKNEKRHIKFFAKYNEDIKRKTEAVLKYYDIDPKEARPRDIKGIEHQIGVYTKDGEYAVFKTIGAKRYMYKDAAGEYHLTVAGLNKKAAIKYLTDTYGDDTMKVFNESLYIPKGETGKELFTYIDEEKTAWIEDYMGKTAYIEARSAVHLEGADYSFSMAEQYARYIAGYREIWERSYG